MQAEYRKALAFLQTFRQKLSTPRSPTSQHWRMSTCAKTACCFTGCLSSDTSCTLPKIRWKEAQILPWGGILRKVLADRKAKMKSIRGFNRSLYFPFVLLEMHSLTSNFRFLHKCHVQKHEHFPKANRELNHIPWIGLCSIWHRCRMLLSTGKTYPRCNPT